MVSALLLAVSFLAAPGPYAGLAGTVRSADGAPIPGAVVAAYQDGRLLSASTNELGEFDLPQLVLPATIDVQASRYSTVRLRVDTSPVAVTLAPSTIRESLVVTAAGTQETWRLPITGTTALSGDTIRELPGVTTDEALRVVSGLSLFRRSSSRASNPTTHGVTMRGLSASGASRGVVLLDGIPLNEAFGAWVTWTRIPPLAIGSIDVDRGAQGATFGSDALGGVITVVSPGIERSSASFAAAGGSLGVGSADAMGSARHGRFAGFGTASWFRTDGAIPVAPESRGPADVAADAEWFSALGKASRDSSAGRLTVSAWGGTDDRGNGTRLQRNRMSGSTVAVAWDRALASTQLAARVSLSPNSYTQTFSFVSADRATETLTSTQFVDVTTVRAIMEAGRVIPRGYLTGRAMVSRADADFTDRRTASTIDLSLRDDSEAVAVEAAWTPAGSLTFGAGVRSEWRAAPDAAASRDSATIGSFTAAWLARPGVTIRGSAATATVGRRSGWCATSGPGVLTWQLICGRAGAIRQSATTNSDRWTASAAGSGPSWRTRLRMTLPSAPIVGGATPVGARAQSRTRLDIRPAG
jgi:outer membrane receptor protein involved in Fe transport